MADWLRDFAFHPSSSSRWSKVAESVKVSAGDLSLIETCLGENEDYLIEQIEDHNITQIVTTGHSLGGMLAFAANLWLVGSWTPELNGGITNPKWADLVAKQRLSVRTMGFEAGMNAMLYNSTDKDANQKGMDFLKKVGSTATNTVYGQDVVPRAPGNLKYIKKVVNNLVDTMEQYPTDVTNTFEFMLFCAIQYYKQGADKYLPDWAPILEKFQHMGKIIYYSDADAEPKAYADPRDDGVGCNKLEGTSFPKFGHKLCKAQDKVGFTQLAAYLASQRGFIAKGPGMPFS